MVTTNLPMYHANVQNTLLFRALNQLEKSPTTHARRRSIARVSHLVSSQKCTQSRLSSSSIFWDLFARVKTDSFSPSELLCHLQSHRRLVAAAFFGSCSTTFSMNGIIFTLQVAPVSLYFGKSCYFYVHWLTSLFFSTFLGES